MFDIVKREKAVSDFQTEHKLRKVMKTKEEQIADEAKQILSCTPLIDVIPLEICGIKGHAIKTDTNKWTVYLEDQSKPMVKTSEQILADEKIIVNTPEFIVSEDHRKNINRKKKRESKKQASELESFHKINAEIETNK